MKTIIVSIFSLFFVTVISAQEKQTVKVWGNCGMCKSTIEKAAKGAGAADAEWNKDTKILTVGTKADMKKVEQAIAAAGYDTQNFTAKDEAYFNLPECCQYERKAGAAVSADEKKADCCKGGKCEKGEKGMKGSKGSKDCKDCASCEKCKKGECTDCSKCKK